MDFMLFTVTGDNEIVPFACGPRDTCKGCRGTCKGCSSGCQGCTGGLFIG